MQSLQPMRSCNLLARVFPELVTMVPSLSAHWVLEMLELYPSAKKIAQTRTLWLDVHYQTALEECRFSEVLIVAWYTRPVKAA